MAPSRPGSGRTALTLLSAPGAGAQTLAEVLEAAGAAPPADPAAVADLNDRALAALGSGRDEPFGPRRRGGEPAPPHALLAEAQALLATADPHAPLLLLADPAAARLAGFWTRALEAQGWRTAALLLARPPAEAAAVHAAASGLTRNRALLLWGSSMIEAERASRGGRRVVVAWDRLLADPEGELDRIERGLALRLPRRTWDSAAEIEALLARAGPPPAAPALPEALAPLAAFAEHLQAAAADEPGNADVPAETERWFAALAELAAPASRRTAEPPPAAAAPSPSMQDEALRRRAVEAEARAGAAEAQVQAAEAQAAVLGSALAVSRRRAAEAETLLQARATEASAGEREARSALALAVAGREAAQDELDRAHARLAELDGRAGEMAEQIAELDGRLVEADAGKARLAEALRLSETEHRTLAAELDDERERHGDAREHLAVVGVGRHAALVRLRETQAQLQESERRRRWLPRLFGLR